MATEFEYLYLANDNMVGANQVFVVMFTLIFGYLAGLYLFVRKTTLTVRLISYVFFTVTLFFIWTGGVFAFAVARKLMEMRGRMIAAGELPDTYSLEAGERLAAMIEVNVWLFNLLTAGVALVFFYLTIFYKWKVRA